MDKNERRARRLLVIFNPTAGSRKRRRLTRWLARLEALGATVTLVETAGPRHAEAIARASDPVRFDAVAIAGGDGTINEAVNGLRRGAPPLAIVPLGTANVLALEIGVNGDAHIIADTIARGMPVPIHCGRINGRRFLMMAGVGFDAHVVERVTPPLKRRLGRSAYILRTVTEAIGYRGPWYRLTVDGSTLECASAVIDKGHFYGGKFVCAPDARLDMPEFQTCLFGRGGGWQALRYGAALAAGRLQSLRDIKLVSGKRIVIDGPEGEPVQADGDIVARLPAVIDVAPDKLPILVPNLADRPSIYPARC